MPTISVIIPVKNEAATIERCLTAVFDQTLTPSEVLVVNGNSTDDTVERAQRYPVKVVSEPYGTVGGARAVGVEHAAGDFVAFTDADCIPERTWLEELSKGFDAGIIGVGGGTKNIGTGLWEETIALALDSFLGSALSVQDRVLDGQRAVKSLSGCNSMYRTADLLRVGNFDRGLSMNEDTELNERLRKHGKLLYTPNAIVLHNQSRDLKSFARRMFQFGYGRGKSRLLDLQIVPPFLALLTVVLLFVSFKAFLFMIALYVLILLFFDLKIVMSAKTLRYLASIPLVFVLEHVAYAAGFWLGFVRGLGGGVATRRFADHKSSER